MTAFCENMVVFLKWFERQITGELVNLWLRLLFYLRLCYQDLHKENWSKQRMSFIMFETRYKTCLKIKIIDLYWVFGLSIPPALIKVS